MLSYANNSNQLQGQMLEDVLARMRLLGAQELANQFVDAG